MVTIISHHKSKGKHNAFLDDINRVGKGIYFHIKIITSTYVIKPII